MINQSLIKTIFSSFSSQLLADRANLTHRNFADVERLEELVRRSGMESSENVSCISSEVGADHRAARMLLMECAHIIHLPQKQTGINLS